jgi:hypothetical protein
MAGEQSARTARRNFVGFCAPTVGWVLTEQQIRPRPWTPPVLKAGEDPGEPPDPVELPPELPRP